MPFSLREQRKKASKSAITNIKTDILSPAKLSAWNVAVPLKDGFIRLEQENTLLGAVASI
jgi:hypothetical protein